MSIGDFETMHPFRARGLDQLEQRVGDVCVTIESMLQSQEAVRILEVGCGYGTCLLQLKQRFRERISVVGINRKPTDGNRDLLSHNATVLGLDPKASDEIEIIFTNVRAGLPFDDESFDLIFSQSSFLYFPDKLHFLEEVRRVLSSTGVARLDAKVSFARNTERYRELIEIWDGESVLSFFSFVADLPGISIATARFGSYLEVRAGDPWPILWEQVVDLDLRRISNSFLGRLNVYRLVDDPTRIGQGLRLRPDMMKADTGFALRYPTINHPRLANAELYEDGVPLGPSTTDHTFIREIGLGGYSLWESGGSSSLFFSSSDNSDPRLNGREYTLLARGMAPERA